MNGVRKIATNTVTLAVSEIVSKGALFLLFAYLGRAFGDVTFGTFNFAYSFGLLAAMLMDIGINYMIVREISRKKEATSGYLVNAILIKAFFSAIAFVLVFISLGLMGKGSQTSLVVYLLCIFAFARSFTELVFSVFKAHERMYYEASIKIISLLALLAGGIVVLMHYRSIVALAAVFALTEVLSFIAGILIVHFSFDRLVVKIDKGICIEIVKKALPFTLSLVSGAIYFNIAAILLSIMKDDAAVGAYSAAYNLTMALLFIPGMYSYAIYPIFSRDYNSQKDKVKFIYERSLKYLLILGMPITIGLFLLSRKIILFIYGTEYFYPSIIALQILVWLVAFKFAGYITGVLLSSINRQRLRMYAQVVTAVASIILNLLLIPPYGFAGAAVATVVSEIGLFAITYLYASWAYHKVNLLKYVWKPAIGSAAMALALVYINLNLFIMAFIGFFVYSGVIVLLGAFDSKDKELAKRLAHDG